ncbi:MAG: GPR endopeptidase [Oscillospiraceae bacterium]|nr:GPR endopeptidase [Oscillospiraceae bacterium]
MQNQGRSSRTDLAVERAEQLPECSGIHMRQRGHAFRITDITIDSDEQGAAIGRGKGHYLTLESGDLHHETPQLREQVTELAAELRQFLPEGAVLVAGLGNAEITPDAIGPETAGRILATRHLRRELQDNAPDTAFLRGLRQVSVLANGVLGQTGIETAELIAALKETVQPACVVAIDALACSDLRRLGTTVQISDAGISPGSGVQNRRAELSLRTLGIPVLAIGVPTVVDLHTVIMQAASEHMQPDLHAVPNMMVTPRNIDQLLHHAARLLAFALNLALHPELSYEDAEAL